jgi:hypothetical protein
MAKKKFLKGIVRLGLVLLFGLALMGCAALGQFATGYAAGYSSTSDTGLMYKFYNYSSETIYFTAPGGKTGSLPPNSIGEQTLNSDMNLYNLTYSPSDKVNISISGTSVTFTDK